MRRHPNRMTPKEYDESDVRLPRRRKMLFNLPKRGPKRGKRWPLLNYTIERDVGVVFHDE